MDLRIVGILVWSWGCLDFSDRDHDACAVAPDCSASDSDTSPVPGADPGDSVADGVAADGSGSDEADADVDSYEPVALDANFRDDGVPSPDLQLARGSMASFVNAAGRLAWAESNTPRLTFRCSRTSPTVTQCSPLGLLLERSSTNVLSPEQLKPDTWTIEEMTLEDGTTLAPDESAPAMRYMLDWALTFTTSVTLSQGWHAFSTYARAVEETGGVAAGPVLWALTAVSATDSAVLGSLVVERPTEPPDEVLADGWDRLVLVFWAPASTVVNLSINVSSMNPVLASRPTRTTCCSSARRRGPVPTVAPPCGRGWPAWVTSSPNRGSHPGSRFNSQDRATQRSG